MRQVPELVDAVKKNLTRRRDPKDMIGTTRVDIRHVEQKTFAATYKTEDKTFEILIDEPAVRGGQSKGPTPLGLFVAGAGS
jgi:hypothetical protein